MTDSNNAEPKKAASKLVYASNPDQKKAASLLTYKKNAEAMKSAFRKALSKNHKEYFKHCSYALRKATRKVEYLTRYLKHVGLLRT